MKLAALIARYLLGIGFLLFGLNGFFDFIPRPPMPPGNAGQFIGVFMASHYVLPVSFFELSGAVLLLANRYVPLALTLLGPILVNILIYHCLMAPSTIAPGLVFTILWFLVFSSVRSAFTGIFQQTSPIS